MECAIRCAHCHLYRSDIYENNEQKTTMAVTRPTGNSSADVISLRMTTRLAGLASLGLAVFGERCGLVAEVP